MCNCHCRTPELESTGVTLAGGVMQISVIPLQQYRDYEGYTLDVCVALPPHIGTEPTNVTDGVGIYPLMDTNGQPVVSGQLRGHRWYHVTFGAGGALSSGSIPAHFTVCDGLCCLEYSSNAALQEELAPV